MYKDPVCGMSVKTSDAAGCSMFADEIYYFCCPECQRRFDAGPEQFVSPQPKRARIPCCGFGMVRPTHQSGKA
jgi:YHS domain-containing protein